MANPLDDSKSRSPRRNGTKGCGARRWRSHAFILVGCVALAPTVWAQTVVWEEGFDEGILPPEWSIVGGVWEVGTLPPAVPGPGGALNGPLAATRLDGLYPADTDAALVRESAFLVPSAGLNPVLQFFNWRELANDTCSVEIRIIGGEWTALRTFNTDQVFWWREFISLSSFAGQLVQVRFRLQSDGVAEGAGWYVDAVSVVADESEPAPPVIVVQPAGVEGAPPGAAVSFSVQVEGSTPLSYQWRKNGERIPGADEPTYGILAAAATDSGVYSVVVNNLHGAAFSDLARLTVDAESLPFSDGFAERGVISSNAGVGRGGNQAATSEAEEPLHADKKGGRSVWLRWDAPTSGIAKVTTAGSDFDTLLAIYTGEVLTELTPLVGDDDGGGFYASSVVFNVTGGQSYQIAVDGRGGARGNVVLNWSLEVTEEAAPRILAQPKGVVFVDSAVSLEVAAEAEGVLVYQWYRNDIPIPGANSNRLEFPQVTRDDVGDYTVEVRAGSRSVTSAAASLEVGSLPGQPMQDKLVDVIDTLESGPPLRRQSSAPPAFITPRLGHLDFREVDTSKSRTEPGETNLVTGGSSKNIELQLDQRGHLTISATNTTLDTVIAIYPIPEGAKSFFDIPLHQPLAQYYDQESNGWSRISAVVHPGSYLLRVDDSLGQGGPMRLEWTLELPPEIVRNPIGGTYVVGDRVELTVEAAGEPAPSYQWWKNGEALAGENRASLVFDAVELQDAGTYSVAISSVLGTIESQPVRLEIQSLSGYRPFFLQHPQDARLEYGEGLRLTATAEGQPELELQWWWNDELISGASGQDLVLDWNELVPRIERHESAKELHAGLFYVVASNQIGKSTSDVARVTVSGFFLPRPVMTANHQLRLSFPAESGRLFRIDVSTNLWDWTTAVETTVATDPVWPDPISLQLPRRFYRVVLDPP